MLLWLPIFLMWRLTTSFVPAKRSINYFFLLYFYFIWKSRNVLIWSPHVYLVISSETDVGWKGTMLTYLCVMFKGKIFLFIFYFLFFFFAVAKDINISLKNEGRINLLSERLEIFVCKDFDSHYSKSRIDLRKKSVFFTWFLIFLFSTYWERANNAERLTEWIFVLKDQ